jgi:two-component system chemotaxis response regulator CheB
MPLRILVVDDTAIYRKIVSDILREIDGVEVVGTAIDGTFALEKIAALKPDLVTLDLEMPQLNGVEVLRQLRAQQSPVGVLMLSAFTSEGAAATTEALRLGAFDFVLKPVSESLLTSSATLRQKLAERITAYAQSRNLANPVQHSAPEKPKVVTSKIVPARGDEVPEVIVLGISTGGPEALNRVIPALPADLAAPLFIVQHMPPGDCLIAPGGKQMKIERTELGPVVHITDDPPENSCRPAVDYLFRSAAHHYGSRVVAIVMTGMGSDGTLGCRLLKRHGAMVLAQDKESCVVFGMPSIIVADGLADRVVSLNEMPSAIVAATRPHAGQGVAACR